MLKKLSLLLAAAGLLAACGGSNDQETIKVGVTGDQGRELWEDVEARFEADTGADMEIVVFNDYVQPNVALQDGELDLNAFQHSAYLRDYLNNEGGQEDLTALAYTFISPVLVFSDHIDQVSQIPDGSKVAIPNSPTVANRAYLALQAMGLIKLDPAVGFEPTKDDIVENTKNIEIVEMEASQVPRSLADVDLILTGTDFAVDAGLKIADAIYSDTDQLDKVDPTKKNIIAVKKDRAEEELIQAVVRHYHQPETAEKIKEVSQGANLPAWSDQDDALGDFEKLMAK
ncbi:hypothetical protein AWM75_07350 [Aerococcus urinaehominis]|uniref:Uncharacterized protein n=1 Tax=Aerococcus urinaehominis TaxID=128944 RepID=A0A120IB10_9LACT|nr:MetQ/NlpA family ABC transporter substrate-binding protein [Aerococcus urinaehominis]AMB99789.1 hypothetical protein AWM75_07350 [Aerococcus urinaehominis]SDM08944.1 D-methionine transport system substrate-binding protein [Aerococcus urinaehominis]